MSSRKKIIILLAGTLGIVLFALIIKSMPSQEYQSTRKLTDRELLISIRQVDQKANSTFVIQSSKNYPNGYYLVIGKTDYVNRVEYLVIDQYPKYPKPFAFNPWDKSAYPADLPDIPQTLQYDLSSLYPDTEWE